MAHSRHQDRQAIHYHYDVSNEFYAEWLDPAMVYSCAYFEAGNEDLALAQQHKLDHILTKVRLQPGQCLLDIGSGWGARCVGITLSDNQHRLATERVRQAGLQDRVEIRLQDYRDVSGTFDRITSTDPDNGETRHGGGRFIDRYVFPQGELPHLSSVLRAAQLGGLEAFDVENLRRHYVRTLACWSEAFEAKGGACVRWWMKRAGASGGSIWLAHAGPLSTTRFLCTSSCAVLPVVVPMNFPGRGGGCTRPGRQLVKIPACHEPCGAGPTFSPPTLPRSTHSGRWRFCHWRRPNSMVLICPCRSMPTWSKA